MTKVGVRDLKARLSHHLKRVQAGETLVVTDRGREIATLSPAKPAPDHEWAWRMVREGRARWNGGKPVVKAPRARLRGGPPLSQTVLEDRR
ncbi:antitoxin [Luteitalea sp. TBR-22]|uniref:type II toxin-antitoxin system Phd/YefM family antitoxin n=1 Tax=Luteitalea sp. TBR-22 TaxID=2802971 RepID=UPI001AF18CF2|nr:type II toxin-antitoxin system prevent-host-death family antitoxin [Luteitalea sp. TBR-22]BCS35959.1 antitoxin [Luteitalea sp. TBR-22]